MTAEEELTAYLYEEIPIVGAMKIAVNRVSELSVSLRMPLAPNRNHMHTQFAGSICTLGLLAGWSLLYSKMRNIDPAATIVAQTSTTKFLLPITKDCDAEVIDLELDSFTEFAADCKLHKKARITLNSRITVEGQIVAVHEGKFAGIHLSNSG